MGQQTVRFAGVAPLPPSCPFSLYVGVVCCGGMWFLRKPCCIVDALHLMRPCSRFRCPDPASLDRPYPARGWRVRGRVRGRSGLRSVEGRTPAFGRKRPTPGRWPACHSKSRNEVEEPQGLTRRLPAWSISPATLPAGAGSVFWRALRLSCRATGYRRPRPALHAARARRCRRHRRPAQHPRVLPAVKAWLRAGRLAAVGLDAGSARAADGQLSDDASFRSRTLPPRGQAHRAGDPPDGRSRGMARYFDHGPNGPRLPDRPHWPHRRVRQEHEIAGGDQVHGRSSGKTSSGAGEHYESWESGDEEPGGGEKDGQYDQSTTTLAHDTDSCHEPADPMYVHRGWRGAPPLRTLHGSRRVAAGQLRDAEARGVRRGGRRHPWRAAAPVLAGQRLAAGPGPPSR